MVRQPPTAPPTAVLIQDAIYAALAMTDDYFEPSRAAPDETTNLSAIQGYNLMTYPDTIPEVE